MNVTSPIIKAGKKIEMFKIDKVIPIAKASILVAIDNIKIECAFISNSSASKIIFSPIAERIKKAIQWSNEEIISLISMPISHPKMGIKAWKIPKDRGNFIAYSLFTIPIAIETANASIDNAMATSTIEIKSTNSKGN